MKKIYSYFQQILLYSFLILYIFILLKILLFKYISPLEIFSTGRVFSRTINLIPIQSTLAYFLGQFSLKVALMNILGNIIIFIPLGIYFQMFKKDKSIIKGIAIVCFFSLSVEITQYIFGIGGSDIDDVILNTIGGLLGILIYTMIALLLKNERRTRTAIVFGSGMVGVLCLSGILYFTPSLLGLKKNVEMIVIGEELGVFDKDYDVMGTFTKVDGQMLTVYNSIDELNLRGVYSEYKDGEMNILITDNTKIYKKSIDFDYSPNEILVTYENFTFEQVKQLKKDDNINLHITEENGILIAKDLCIYLDSQ